jgi:hypothetical protein
MTPAPLSAVRIASFALLAAAWAGACTFPSVDYSPTGAGGSSSSTGGADGGVDAPDTNPPGCELPKDCSQGALSCVETAHDDEGKCTKKCKNAGDEDSCKKACASAFSDELGSCAADCVSCSGAEGCAMQDSACAALVSN